MPEPAPASASVSTRGPSDAVGGFDDGLVAWSRPSAPTLIAMRLVSAWRAGMLRARGARVGPGLRVGADGVFLGCPGMEIGARTQIGVRARFEVQRTQHGLGRLVVGEDTRILNDVHIGAASLVEIGAHCGIAAGCLIIDHEHDFSAPLDADRRNRRISASPVVLEDHAFLGERAIVLKGVRIGRGAVIGANSVVTRSVEPFTMQAGSPARTIARHCADTGRWVRVGGRA